MYIQIQIIALSFANRTVALYIYTILAFFLFFLLREAHLYYPHFTYKYLDTALVVEYIESIYHSHFCKYPSHT